MEHWTSDTGQRLHIHDVDTCWGPYCPIHAPSQHTLVSAPRHWRGDRGIMERICDHGIRHPDPDEWKVIHGLESGTHGCDGCCREVGNALVDEAEES